MVGAANGCRNFTMKHISILIAANLLAHPPNNGLGSYREKFFFRKFMVDSKRLGIVCFHKLMQCSLVSFDLTCFRSLDGRIFVHCRHIVGIKQAAVKVIQIDQWYFFVRSIAAVLLCPMVCWPGFVVERVG